MLFGKDKFSVSKLLSILSINFSHSFGADGAKCQACNAFSDAEPGFHFHENDEVLHRYSLLKSELCFNQTYIMFLIKSTNCFSIICLSLKRMKDLFTSPAV